MAASLIQVDGSLVGNQNLTAPLGATFLAVAWAAGQQNSVAPTFTWNGVGLTEDVDFGGAGNRSCVYHLQLPITGLRAFACGGAGWQQGTAWAFWARKMLYSGDPVHDTDGLCHAANDYLTATLAANAGGLCVYAGTKSDIAGVWSNLEDGVGYLKDGGIEGGAYEIPAGAGESATFGSVGDSKISIAGVSYYQGLDPFPGGPKWFF